MTIAIAIGILFTPAVVRAFDVNDPPCRDVVITVDLSNCLADALEKQDAILNKTYLRTMEYTEKETQEQLRKAQRAWIRYRDAACEAEASLYRGGTAEYPARMACLERMTRMRNRELVESFGWRVEKFSEE
jgi:uncharacterized protein YecT (DUF1311 family)